MKLPNKPKSIPTPTCCGKPSVAVDMNRPGLAYFYCRVCKKEVPGESMSQKLALNPKITRIVSSAQCWETSSGEQFHTYKDDWSVDWSRCRCGQVGGRK